PPGVQNGQTIDLNDPGAAAGILRLTLSVLPGQQSGVPSPPSWPGQAPVPGTSTFINNTAPASSGAGWGNPNNPTFLRNEPGVGSNVPMGPGMASGGGWGNPNNPTLLRAEPGMSPGTPMGAGIPSGAGWANPDNPTTPPYAQWQSGPAYFAPTQAPPMQE